MFPSIPRRSVLCGLLLLALPALAAGTTRTVNPDGLCGGSTPCYADLQSAIDASSPGDLIAVQAALYPLTSTVLVDRPVEIYGPQAGVNPLPSRGTLRVAGSGAEAILDGGGTLGVLLRILADDVLLDGLEVRDGTGDLVESLAGTPTSRTRLRNNILHGSSGDEGVQLRATTDAVVECNHVFATAGDGLNLCCGSTGGILRFNEVHDCSSENAAIYVYNSTDTRIEGNLVYDTTQNEGIKLGAKYGPDAALTGGVVLHNTTRATAQDGIAVYMSRTSVSCNDVSASASENGGIYVAWEVADVSITDNYVHDNSFDTGKWGDPAGIMIGAEPDASTITVSGNRLVNNRPNGLTNKAAAQLAAGSNWWGAADGPGPVGPGTGDAVSANVDFTPWLGSAPSPACPPIGTCDGGFPTPARVSTWGGLKAIYR
jgi:nitrous oxidase accessory protein NosD